MCVPVPLQIDPLQHLVVSEEFSRDLLDAVVRKVELTEGALNIGDISRNVNNQFECGYSSLLRQSLEGFGFEKADLVVGQVKKAQGPEGQEAAGPHQGDLVSLWKEGKKLAYMELMVPPFSDLPMSRCVSLV